MVKFRQYDPILNAHPIEFLYDADEYYQDILESIKGLSEPKIFLTGWVIVPDTSLSNAKRLRDVIIDLLNLPNSVCYILWNSNISGPNPGIVGRIENFRKEVARALGGNDIDQKLKIIISANLGFDEGWKLSLLNQASRAASWSKDMPGIIPPSVLDKAQNFWTSQFEGKDVPKRDYRNLRIFTAGSNHQKAIVFAGKKQNHQALIGYCGMDFAPNVAGSNGGKDWHDAGIRVVSDMAIGLLENFTQRWNWEIQRLKDVVAFGVSATDELDPDVFFTKEDHDLADRVETRRTIPVRVDLHLDYRVTVAQWALRAWFRDIRRDYLDWIDDAEEWIFIENQYFRHLEVAEALLDALDDEANLHLTIVLPAYSEEIGLRNDMGKLRRDYSLAIDVAQRQKLMTQVKMVANTIDPYSKAYLLFQSKCLADLVPHPRVKVWMPQVVQANRVIGLPYVHSKFMIVDDQALMIGSANLNGRSLDGYADSELNLLLTDEDTIKRIKGRIKWQNEPDDEKDPRYKRWSNADPTPTFYARYNLVRYTAAHLEVDKELGTFPIGKEKILDYWEAFNKNKSKRVSTFTPDLTRAQMGQVLDNLNTPPVLDIETFDWNAFFLSSIDHLI